MTEVQLVRLTAVGRREPPHRREAFAVFAFALAVGVVVVVHEWNSTWDAGTPC